ncbi:MAG: SDR family NAD(P)-dependent oxidoreductase [Deltaproteobacteria bacterium]|nr:MAG: SDR family NAD(P)-dependent oxidoreductase [Deltaproteobacteria bacterium]
MRLLITGGTNGMGKGLAEVVAGLDDRSHEVVILGRSAERGEATIRELTERTGNPRLSFVQCDLTRLSEVRSAAREITERWPSLDGVFVNAGLGYAASRVETEDGMDPHFQVNYLAHFMLVLSLLPVLERSEMGGRVVFNVSEGGEIHWDDLQMEKKWGFERGISQAMVAKRLLLLHLHEHLSQRGSTLSFIGYRTPKTVWSNQVNIIPAWMKMMASLAKLAGQFISIERSGEIMAPLFTADQAQTREWSGKLLTWKKKSGFSPMAEDPLVLDAGNRKRLWQLSLALCQDKDLTRLAERYVAQSA